MTGSSTAAARTELVEAVNRAMRQASGMGVLFSQAMAERLGINNTDLECLDIVLMRGAMTAGSLARLSGLTSGAITGVIDRLERAGLARREADPGDRRKVLVAPTAETEARAAPLAAPMEKAMTEVLAAYSDAELALFIDFFQRAREGWAEAMAEVTGRPADQP
jgi:DNA-binding MarR family transcriptional regulator